MSIAVATLLLGGVAGCGADNQTGMGTNNYQVNRAANDGMFGGQGATGRTGVTGQGGGMFGGHGAGQIGVTGQGGGMFGGQGAAGGTGVTGHGGGMFGGQGAAGRTGITGHGGGMFGGQGATGQTGRTGITGQNDGYYGLPSYDVRGFDERALGGLGRGLEGDGNVMYGGEVIGGQTDETTPHGLERHGSYRGQRGTGNTGMNR